MVILESIIILYFLFGFFYALYILLFAGDAWYWFPINMLGGPVVVIMIVLKTLRGKKIPLLK
ncbi:hypothetical protein A3F07_00250 [candidate division WWE3 bacterium RIFCSPHIGHO2_12_FULL_38_15]|uniref:Uncharacterized protein n=1 Tax=candidate division WWE3 bacterium RIFCSPHIGHO2_02_FULL_38_14 TaxID=1802620 RepID=A0A1F4V6P0_UNCKA|nr:MAG: hypothetical protein A2793_02140 [candidate division WWE3 bacterium RIFCSPHIGHO2_01_FULL_38_45]OGC49269.1 MAG: hypothetical protein A3F07_00250 [candidate division WWE3 bacterium RIFCSPHIGHO2_12_FULL_38_15]OGC52670.1 MAG: hypothetical protein A3D91_03295 [candidate division WWE3 bacterium RIFCSPHIGHO2_02_FULL_38_14]OGC53758.1 MAG: hypothetical protein A3B64_03525 [candidate division WWE3 bacterium RIFCSPLOWO2_01_FULL_37_24]